jgi:hypothetical protein
MDMGVNVRVSIDVGDGYKYGDKYRHGDGGGYGYRDGHEGKCGCRYDAEYGVFLTGESKDAYMGTKMAQCVPKS